jgi:hypothetical protein
MHAWTLRFLSLVLVAGAMIGAGCRQRQYPQAQYLIVVDADQDPGAHVAATNEVSLLLLEGDSSARRVWFQSFLAQHGHSCTSVTSAVLKGGDDGTDVWRVGCVEGAWLVTLGPGTRASADGCSAAGNPYCIDQLAPLRWRPGS